jgi:hypothetical protein
MLAIGRREYNRQWGDTDILCNRCNTTYKRRHKKRHQNTAKCQRVYEIKRILYDIRIAQNARDNIEH